MYYDFSLWGKKGNLHKWDDSQEMCLNQQIYNENKENGGKDLQERKS